MRITMQLSVLLCLLLTLATAYKLDKATKQRKEICTLDAQYGNCKGHQWKWYYDFVRDRCRQFDFSGCGGNQNLFHSQSSCIDYCLNPSSKYNMQDFENDYGSK
ncbi:uncharacterized protein Dvir_GJ25858 [Drosophila virilis]|uniref:BPTI/Kunitz inhibitor domain-containing protein n=1 Tax=Drosophila virilis TaxID=7244 RepID=A0A0Q9W137_DROVI|nr:uncharacterized protein Dvir_GJ25858 [Drosophila virilis]